MEYSILSQWEKFNFKLPHFSSPLKGFERLKMNEKCNYFLPAGLLLMLC